MVVPYLTTPFQFDICVSNIFYFYSPPPFLYYLRLSERQLLCQRVWALDTQCQIILHKSCCQISDNVHLIVFLPAMFTGVVVVIVVVTVL